MFSNRVLGRQGSKTPLTMLVQHRCKDAHKNECCKYLIHRISLSLSRRAKKKVVMGINPSRPNIYHSVNKLIYLQQWNYNTEVVCSRKEGKKKGQEVINPLTFKSFLPLR